MKVSATTPITQFNGSPVTDENNQVVTIRSLIVNALLAGDTKDDGMTKVSKYELAKRIYSTDDVEINEKEITLIKEVTGKMYGPLAVGQIYDILKV